MRKNKMLLREEVHTDSPQPLFAEGKQVLFFVLLQGASRQAVLWLDGKLKIEGLLRKGVESKRKAVSGVT